MKKLLALLMAVLLVVSAVPVSTFAIDQSDPEFDAFLKEINWSKKDYINYLKSKDWSLEEFGEIEELGMPLSEEGVQAIMAKYELTRSELNALHFDFGEIEEGEDVLDSIYIIFNEDLDYYTEFYLSAGIDENDTEFSSFLEDINWSKEDYLAFLDSKGWSLADFWEIGELGTPLTEEDVQTVMADFELTREELNALLVDNYDLAEDEDVMEGTSLIFNEDLYSYVEYYLDEENLADIDFGIEGLFTEIGLTDEELDRLFEHFLGLDLEDETFLAQLEVLAERMETIEEFESADELDAAQIAEILDILTDTMNLFQIDAKYYLTDGKEKQPLTLAALMTLESTDGYDLLIEIYNKQGTFLADLILTAEMFGSEIITETAKDLEVVKEVVAAPKKETVKKDVKAVKTVKGAKLPKTASNYLSNALIGLAFVLIGLLLFRRMKTAGN
ncbi:processed acidic surface protein [Metaplanococcus flavidus]|uniref:Processed acidic surface protein n=1 Tax=Metaplanococcus flavidus TaxID=569883 RepID=A0ABW3LD82_9BACL